MPGPWLPAGGRRITSNTPANTSPSTLWTATPTLRPRRSGQLRRHPRRPDPDGPQPRQCPCGRPGQRRTRPVGSRPRRRRRRDRAAGIRARLPGSGGKASVDPATGQALTAADSDLDAAKAASRETPSHLPLGQVRPGSRLLETERKLLTHAIRMSAYNAESALAWLLRPHYARTTPAATTKPAPFSVKHSPSPATYKLPATPCTYASTPPAHPDAATPSPRYAPSSPTPQPATQAPT
jgi:hypothetical protein